MLWVIEMKEGDRWVPTLGVAFSRSDGRITLSEWRENNPDHEFRLRPYYRAVRI